jgi:hypothetical protein
MRNFLVIIRANIPYPKEYRYTIEAGNLGLAGYRGFKKFREELGRKKLQEVIIQIISRANV